jgi:hypothetical protein
MYGPNTTSYSEGVSKYYEVRVLPKLLDLSTEIFRFQACWFRADEHYKENCARFWTQA